MGDIMHEIDLSNFDLRTGLIIEKNKYIKNLFVQEADLSIKWEQIKKVGSDVILIDISS